MGTLYEDGCNLLKKRGMEFVDLFIPPLMCSFAAHAFNLENHKRGFYKLYNRVPDYRMHVLIVSPPGWGRSFTLKQLLHPNYGILNTNTIPMRFEGYSTEAALIGSIEKQGKKTVQIPGLFEEYKDGIIGIEEFFSISQAMVQTHSSHLEPALNQALLDGEVRKRLRAGPIEYNTMVSLWAGTQTTRFTVGGGLLRRFFLVRWIPDQDDEETMRQALRRASNLTLDPQLLKNYRKRVLRFLQDLKDIKSIRFTDDTLHMFDNVPHYREMVLRKLALGYNLINKDLSKNIVVEPIEGLPELVRKSERWRRALVGDPEGDMVTELLDQYNGVMDYEKLKIKLLDFSIKFQISNKIIRRMKRNSMLFQSEGKVYTREAWKREKKRGRR